MTETRKAEEPKTKKRLEREIEIAAPVEEVEGADGRKGAGTMISAGRARDSGSRRQAVSLEGKKR